MTKKEQVRKMMEVIWYNPDIDRYQKGLQRNYEIASSLSPNADRFEILYEFENTESCKKIATKILSSLNQVRDINSTKREIFV